MKNQIRHMLALTALLASFLCSTPSIQAAEYESAADENFVGQSLGGNIRQGPGLEYDALHSVKQGTWLTIIRRSKVTMDDFDWFEVRFDDGIEGFMWGGILCSNGQLLAGVHTQCVN